MAENGGHLREDEFGQRALAVGLGQRGEAIPGRAVGDRPERARGRCRFGRLHHLRERPRDRPGRYRPRTRPGGQPVALPLEGIRGQRDAAPTRAFQDPVPGDGHAAYMQTGHSRGERVLLRAAGPGRGQEGRVGGDAVPAHGREHGVRSDFEVDRHAQRFERAHAVEEPDTPTGVAHPVVGVEQFPGRDRAAGEVGDDRKRGLTVGQVLGDPAELSQHAVHVRRVEGMADPQPPGPAPTGPPGVGDGADGIGVPGYHRGGWTVERGDLHAAGEVGEPRDELGLRSLDGDHRSAFRQGLHQATARGDEGGGVGQGEHAGGICGAQLADGVAEQSRRDDPPVPQEPEQGGLVREQRRLGVDRLIEQGGGGRVRGAEDQVADRTVEVLVQLAAGGVEGIGERGLGDVQSRAHAGPLTTLTGEEEREAAFGRLGGGADDAGRGTAAGEVAEGRGEAVAAVGQQCGPVCEMAARQGGGAREVGQGEVGMGRQVFAQPLGLGAQRGVHMSGQQDGYRPGFAAGAAGAVASGRRGQPGGVGQHEVAVGAGHSEGADAREHRTVGVVRGEVDAGDGDLEAQGVERDRRVRTLVVEAGWQGALAQA